MTAVAWIAVVSITITILIVLVTGLINLSYRQGHTTARVEALEVWRGTVRGDLHEVSEKLTAIEITLAKLMTLVRERTDRRLRLDGTVAPDDDRRAPGGD